MDTAALYHQLPSGRRLPITEPLSTAELEELQTPEGIVGAEAVIDLLELTKNLGDDDPDPTTPEYRRLVDVVNEWRLRADVRALVKE